MLTYINFKAVEIDCDLSAHFTLSLEPGVWELVHNKTTYSVTSLSGTLTVSAATRGQLVFTYPRGVERRASGVWAARERVVPVNPRWNDIPEPVREAIADAYLLQRHELPESLETS